MKSQISVSFPHVQQGYKWNSYHGIGRRSLGQAMYARSTLGANNTWSAMKTHLRKQSPESEKVFLTLDLIKKKSVCL